MQRRHDHGVGGSPVGQPAQPNIHGYRTFGTEVTERRVPWLMIGII
jgi:hypothetical protein